MPSKRLKADARNRAIRTAITAVFTVLCIDVVPLIAAALAPEAGPIRWGELAKAVLRVCLQSGAAYFLRAHVDNSSFPTPLPPSPQPQPADPA